MAKSNRIALDNKLRKVLNSNNVYYRAPESVKIKYPAFKYKLAGGNQKAADNKMYLYTNEYEVIHIDKDPDNGFPEKMLKEFEKIRFVRRYEVDNLIHDVFYLYW